MAAPGSELLCGVTDPGRLSLDTSGGNSGRADQSSRGHRGGLAELGLFPTSVLTQHTLT